MMKFNSFVNRVNQLFDKSGNVFVVITETDCFSVRLFSEFDLNGWNAEKALDIRVFDEKKELRIFRDYIGNEFHDEVELCDSILKDKYSIYDDYQFLDVDLKRTNSESGRIRATGGGEYCFPGTPNKQSKIRIKNYVDYDDNGQAYIVAWRLAGFAAVDYIEKTEAGKE
ncbi:MAG: hypothetical protein K6F26_03375 [Lachnospiraceae bacterium]|nr:hypothetical protein [Lachnospiraceae bacterium]